ncbi:MAG TPA: sigma-70 family RNA polymerase sigma factor [Methylomirabilota bacterium]
MFRRRALRVPARRVNPGAYSFVWMDERAQDNRQRDVQPSPSPNALVAAHSGRLRRLCRLLLGDAQEAEDVVQEVFLKAHETAWRGGDPVAWGAWLTRVAVNACRDRRRAGGWMRLRFRSSRLDDVTLAAQTPAPSDAAISEDTRRRIWAAFRELPRRQQEVFLLRYVEEQSTPDVAAALGLSPGSVKRHLYRAVRHLRRALGDAR